MVMLCKTAVVTVTVVLPLITPEVAVITALPVAMAVTRP